MSTVVVNKRNFFKPRPLWFECPAGEAIQGYTRRVKSMTHSPQIGAENRRRRRNFRPNYWAI